MRRTLLLVGMLAAALALVLPTATAGVVDRYVVVLGSGDPGQIALEHLGRAPDHVYRHAVLGYAAPMPPALAATVARDPRVVRVEPDRPVRAFAQEVPTGVRRVGAAASTVARPVDVDVAVLDTGVDAHHPDLHVVTSVDCTVAVLAGCRTGRAHDAAGHGTHVAGTLAARDDGAGVVGVAPGARIHAVKVLTDVGVGLGSDSLAGLDWVAARSGTIEVVNMSLGGQGWSATERQAIAALVRRGVVVVAAAGNDRRDIYGADGTRGTRDDVTPAAYPEVMAISAMADFDGVPGGATDRTRRFGSCTEASDDSFACFSNVSRAGAIDLVLPGVDIRSTLPGNRYGSMSGTSMAAPHAAGLVALHVAAFGRPVDARGVDGLRAALRAAAWPQDAPGGFAELDDPDGVREPVGRATA